MSEGRIMFWGVFDHRPENRRLDGLNQVAELFQATSIDRAPDPGGDWKGVLFVHAGEATGVRPDNWIRIADPSRQRYVVFVSSHPDAPLSSPDRGYFAVRRSVPDFVRALKSQPETVRKFKEGCESGAPPWSLLEGTDFPESLLAWYLVLLAKTQSVTIDQSTLPDDLVASARREFDHRKLRGEEFDQSGIAAVLRRASG